jgi:hypothetical protein
VLKNAGPTVVGGDETRPDLPAIGRSWIRLVTHIAPAETTLDVVGGWRPIAGFWVRSG